MIFNIGGGANAKSQMPDFTYTGRYQVINDSKVNGVQNWRIKLLSDGDLKFNRVVPNIDVFLVGGGGGGASGGGGGGGGYTRTSSVTVERGRVYSVTIGDGGSAGLTPDGQENGGDGQTTRAFGLSASGGKGGIHQEGMTGTYGGAGGSGGGGFGGGNGGTNGSNGGQARSGYPGGNGQGRSTREFGSNSGTLYAGGGGGGNYSEWSYVGGQGGAGGGGDGHQSQFENGHNGSANTGGGGGGGLKQATGTNGGKGGSGIVVIRNAR